MLLSDRGTRTRFFAATDSGYFFELTLTLNSETPADVVPTAMNNHIKYLNFSPTRVTHARFFHGIWTDRKSRKPSPRIGECLPICVTPRDLCTTKHSSSSCCTTSLTNNARPWSPHTSHPGCIYRAAYIYISIYLYLYNV